MRVFAELESVIGTGGAGFQIAEQGIDPQELGQLPGLPSARHDHIMVAVRIGDTIEAGEAVCQHGAAGSEEVSRPISNGCAREVGDGREFGIDGMMLFIERDRGDERDLVFRSATGLAARMLTAQIGVVGLHMALQRVDLLAFGHGLHQLMMDAPGSGVADAQLPLQGERGQARLGLADQIDSQEPDRQRQVSALEHSASNQRSLVSAGAALKGFARATLEGAVFGVAATRALKTLGPAGGFQHRGALRFGTEALYELGERQALLELNAIHRHGTPLNSEISGHYAPLKKATPNTAEESC